MALEQITKYVIPLTDIPFKLIKNHWLSLYPEHAFVEVHIDEIKTEDPFDAWIEEKYPQLKDEESFFIHINEPTLA